MIRHEMTPYMRMLLSPAKRTLLVAISVIAFGLMLLVCSSFAQTNPAANRTASNAAVVSAMQSSGAEGDTIRPYGWPGSIVEQLKIIGPLTDATAHGGNAEDPFDVVIPSLPGCGFSGKPTTTGWDPNGNCNCLKSSHHDLAVCLNTTDS